MAISKLKLKLKYKKFYTSNANDRLLQVEKCKMSETIVKRKLKPNILKELLKEYNHKKYN